MGMSGAYGKTDDAQSIEVIRAAIERGVTFLDTGDFYGSGHNELLIGKAIAGRRGQVQLSVKFGMLRVCSPARSRLGGGASSSSERSALPRIRTSAGRARDPARWAA
jgi:aryl-alcohol dehydrogenase-like predicted oxidoreductase